MATQRPNPNQRPQDLAGYAYLFKQLDFPVPFERLREPLDFGGANLESFGKDYNKPHHEQMAADVSIVDYRSEDGFVIELKTKSSSIRAQHVNPTSAVGGRNRP